MKVNQSNSNSVQNADVSDAKKAERSEKTEALKKIRDERAAQSVAKNSDAVKADISAKGKEFSKAKAVAEQTPDIREAKVAELKKKITEGNYKIDADKVADRIVSEHMSTADLG